jgi:hypothetical protein
MLSYENECLMHEKMEYPINIGGVRGLSSAGSKPDKRTKHKKMRM